MEKKVEGKKKLGLFLGILIGMLSLSLVWSGYLFFDTQSSTMEISGNNQTIKNTVSLSSNVVLISTNATENMTYTDFVEYVIQKNTTVIFTPIITKTLLDLSCVNFENDCTTMFYLQMPSSSNWWSPSDNSFVFNMNSNLTSPNINSNFTLSEGTTKIKYIRSCIPTSCHQKIQTNFTISGV